MYLDHFGLTVNPFGLSPKINFVFKSGAFEENMAHLIYGLENSEAITLISGPVGSGKTLAIQTFLMKLGSQFSFALVTNTQVSSTELLKLILDDLEISTPIGCDKSDILILFKNFLLQEHQNGRRVVIVIDEAQNLKPDALEEVRLLTNLGQGDFQPVQIVLVGQPELEALLNNPSLRQLRQRIRVHYQLTPLLTSEVEGYLNHRMKVAGCSRAVFSSAAVKKIFQYGKGIPRLTNSLANAALLSAYVAGRDTVKPEDIDPTEAGMPDSQPLDFSQNVELPKPSQKPPVQTELAPPLPPVPQREVPLEPEPYGDSGRKREKTSKLPWMAFVAFLVVVLGSLYFLGYFPEKWSSENLLSGSPEAIENIPIEIPQETIIPKGKPPVVIVKSDTLESQITEAIPAPPPQVDSVFYLVHMASFQVREDAGLYAASLTEMGFPSIVRIKNLEGSDWFRVCLGPFKSEDIAITEISRMRARIAVEYFQIVKLED